MTPEDTGASWLENETRQKLRIRIQTRAIRRCGELLKEVKAALGRQPKQLVPATTLKVLTRKDAATECLPQKAPSSIIDRKAALEADTGRSISEVGMAQSAPLPTSLSADNLIR